MEYTLDRCTQSGCAAHLCTALATVTQEAHQLEMLSSHPHAQLEVLVLVLIMEGWNVPITTTYQGDYLEFIFSYK